jgi:hypothetical protein
MSLEHSIVNKREFLNNSIDNGIAAIKTVVKLYHMDEDNESGEIEPYIDATFVLSDCTRQISLDFDVWSCKDTEQNIDNILYKLDILSSHVNELKKAITDNLPRYRELLARNENFKKQRIVDGKNENLQIKTLDEVKADLGVGGNHDLL